MRTESLKDSYLALPDGPGPHPGVVVIHEASGLSDNIRDICRRFAGQGYAAFGVDLFRGRNRAVCMARMFIGGIGRQPGPLRRPRPQGCARTTGRPARGGRGPDRRDRLLPGWIDRPHLGVHRQPAQGDSPLLRGRPQAEIGDPSPLSGGGLVAGQGLHDQSRGHPRDRHFLRP